MAKEYKAKGFLLYADDADLFAQLDDVGRSSVIMALFEYFINGTIPDNMDSTRHMVFSVIKRNIDRDREKYQRTCEKKRESQRQRWRRKGSKDVHNVNNVDNVNNVQKETKTKTQTKRVLVLDGNSNKNSDVPPFLDGRRTSKALVKNKNDELIADGFFNMTAAEKVDYLERKRKGL